VKKVICLIVLLCIGLWATNTDRTEAIQQPALETPSAIRGTVHGEPPAYPDGSTNSTSWLFYDEGTALNAWAWSNQGNGWGVQFPVANDCWVDSIACAFWGTSWPSPGGTDATFRIYDGATTPTNLRWELVNTTIIRGAWNYFEVDTTQTWFTAGDNVFFFYMQVKGYPNCPGLSIDDYFMTGSCDYPQYMWACVGSQFYLSNNDGDWLMRIHVITQAGPDFYATVDIDPNTLNLKSKGRWVTCYIEFPEGYDVYDVDLGTVALTAIDGETIDPLYREGPTSIGDYDSDGIPDLMVKFNRRDLIAILKEIVDPPADVELTVSGDLIDGTTFEGSDIIRVIWPGGPQTAGQGNLPSVFALYANQPNPFHSMTTLRYALPKNEQVRLSVFDASGRVVKTLVHAQKEAGYHTVRWDGRDGSGCDLPNGIYFYKLETGDFTEMKKMVLIR
jgi:hypothetical protein